MVKKPWEVIPNLQFDALKAVAALIRDTRDDVITLHDQDLGDTVKGTGLRAYECCRTKIIEAALHNSDMPWLGIIEPDGRFTFSINSVPVRFYRGSPNSPTERRLIPCPQALSQMELLNEEVGDASRILWFLAIETNQERYVDKVTFVGYYNDVQVSAVEIPLDGGAPVLAEVHDNKPSPIKVGKAKVTVKSHDKKASENLDGH